MQVQRSRPAVLHALLLLVRRSLRQHAFSSLVTAFSVALGSGLVMAVFSIQKQARDAFTGGDVGFDGVVGARGSQLQLVLNAVYHLETSPGNIPWSIYDDLRRRPYVELAVPYALGDNYRGFRVVGTTEELFTKFEYQFGRKYTIQPGGVVFDPSLQEAVIGDFVARQTGLRVGHAFSPYHGLAFDEHEQHHEEYRVVGVLAPTNTPADRVIWIPIEGVFRLGGHVLRGTGEEYHPLAGEEIADEHKELSAVMLKLTSPKFGMQLDKEINKLGKTATFAWPIANSMAELFNKLGWVNRVLELVAYLVIVVAAASILASIYNTINERRREFAILRALGARRRMVFSAIVLEAAAIAGIGSLFGYVLYAVVLMAAAVVVRNQVGVVLDFTQIHPMLLATPLIMVSLGALAGVVPAVKAYATDVADNLTPHT
ncbi:MAG: ABC transporter permease [Planctomycetes bacterium]|nr:ABC transporter permease [Planctomycetota bacterium]